MFQSSNLDQLSPEQLVERGLRDLAIRRLQGDLSSTGRHQQRLDFLTRRLQYLDGKTHTSRDCGLVASSPDSTMQYWLDQRDEAERLRDRDQALLDQLLTQ